MKTGRQSVRQRWWDTYLYSMTLPPPPPPTGTYTHKLKQVPLYWRRRSQAQHWCGRHSESHDWCCCPPRWWCPQSVLPASCSSAGPSVCLLSHLHPSNELTTCCWYFSFSGCLLASLSFPHTQRIWPLYCNIWAEYVYLLWLCDISDSNQKKNGRGGGGGGGGGRDREREREGGREREFYYCCYVLIWVA